MHTYSLNCGQYVLMRDGVPIRAVVDQIGLAFDKNEGALYKHGEASAIQQWVQERQKKLRDDGCEDMADNLVCLSGRLPLAELNACLANHARLPALYQRAMSGELDEEPLPASLPLPPVVRAPARRSRP